MMTETFTQEHLEFGWWVEIVTNEPHCIYYFGPFFSVQEAQEFLPGYVEDLEKEEAQEILSQVKQCQPKELTIFNEEWQDSSLQKSSNRTWSWENPFLVHKAIQN